MVNVRPPEVPEEPPPVLSLDEQRALLATCTGSDEEARRDTAILLLFVASGMRRAELSGLRLEDLDLDARDAWVMGEVRRPRRCPFDKHTAAAIDRYLRLRNRRADADSPWLWLGRKSRLTEPAWASSSSAAAGRPGSSSTRTCSDIPMRTECCRAACRRAT